MHHTYRLTFISHTFFCCHRCCRFRCWCCCLLLRLLWQVLPEDNTFNWGAVLLRLLPWEQTQRKDLIMSVLRALAYNPSLAVDAPKWQPKVPA